MHEVPGTSEHPRAITRRVVTVLHQRGQAAGRAIPGSPALPRTCWQPHHLRIYHAYSERPQVRGHKVELAADLGISPFELARQFRLAQRHFLEAYYILGVVAAPGVLNRLPSMHRHLDIYDGISQPKRLHRNEDQFYWSDRAVQDRLTAEQRCLLQAAAATLTTEDLGYINLAAVHGWPNPVEIDPADAATAYTKLTRSSSSSAIWSAEPVLGPFAAALHQAEQRFREITQPRPCEPGMYQKAPPVLRGSRV